MKKQIWKYELDVVQNQSIAMPKGAEILTVQLQHGLPQLWVLVDPNQPNQERYIEIFCTGEPIHYDMGVSRKYIGTWQSDLGSFVFHVFENSGI